MVIGPDDPLADGIVDAFDSTGIPVFGPRRNAAEIEGSKTFMKDLLHKYNIQPQPMRNSTITSKLRLILNAQAIPVVIKADGLAAGKGVTVAYSVRKRIRRYAVLWWRRSSGKQEPK